MGARPIALLETKGDARGTRNARTRQLIENEAEKMAERVGFELRAPIDAA